MGTLIDYVLQTGGMDFREKPFTNVDNLILCLLSYVEFEGLVPSLEDNKEPVTFFEALNGKDEPQRLKEIYNKKTAAQLLPLLLISRRFGRIGLNYYVSRTDAKSQSQFSAVTFLLDGAGSFVAFRGTDGTVIGWKEDFNMAFINPVPAQALSADYLNTVAWRLSGDICVGGHSKGGNLAVYAASMCDPGVQKRIRAVYDNDGPGFREEFFRSSGFIDIQDRLQKFVPKSSVVGMLLDHWSEYTVVDSDSFGILQHDPLSWLTDADDFVKLDSVTAGAQLMDATLNKWIDSMTAEQREQFVGGLFQILESTQIVDFTEQASGWGKTALSVLEAVKGIDPEVRRVLLRTIGSLVTLAAKEFTGEKMGKATGRFIRQKKRGEAGAAAALPEKAATEKREE